MFLGDWLRCFSCRQNRGRRWFVCPKNDTSLVFCFRWRGVRISGSVSHDSWGFECGGLRNAKKLTTMERESLNKTWFIDIDGTIVKTRNNEQLDEAINSMGDESYLIEEPIEKSVNCIQSIPFGDTIVLTTARDSRHEGHTLKMLKHFRIRYDRILFDLRSGARVLINDIKPVGIAGNSEPLDMAFAVNVKRNEGIPADCI